MSRCDDDESSIGPGALSLFSSATARCTLASSWSNVRKCPGQGKGRNGAIEVTLSDDACVDSRAPGLLRRRRRTRQSRVRFRVSISHRDRDASQENNRTALAHLCSMRKRAACNSVCRRRLVRLLSLFGVTICELHAASLGFCRASATLELRESCLNLLGLRPGLSHERVASHRLFGEGFQERCQSLLTVVARHNQSGRFDTRPPRRTCVARDITWTNGRGRSSSAARFTSPLICWCTSSKTS